MKSHHDENYINKLHQYFSSRTTDELLNIWQEHSTNYVPETFIAIGEILQDRLGFLPPKEPKIKKISAIEIEAQASNRKHQRRIEFIIVIVISIIIAPLIFLTVGGGELLGSIFGIGALVGFSIAGSLGVAAAIFEFCADAAEKGSEERMIYQRKSLALGLVSLALLSIVVLIMYIIGKFVD
jgi:hypothetical protein